MHLKLLPPHRVWQKTAPVFGGSTDPRTMPTTLPTTAGINLCSNSPHEGSKGTTYQTRGKVTLPTAVPLRATVRSG